jgi:hypothetical protein
MESIAKALLDPYNYQYMAKCVCVCRLMEVVGCEQNDLQRTSLYRRRMIWLLPYPFHTLKSVSWTFDTEDGDRNLLTGGREGVGEEQNYTTAKKPGPL